MARSSRLRSNFCLVHDLTAQIDDADSLICGIEAPTKLAFRPHEWGDFYTSNNRVLEQKYMRKDDKSQADSNQVVLKMSDIFLKFDWILLSSRHYGEGPRCRAFRTRRWTRTGATAADAWGPIANAGPRKRGSREGSASLSELQKGT